MNYFLRFMQNWETPEFYFRFSLSFHMRLIEGGGQKNGFTLGP